MEASLPPLDVILRHQTLHSYERALRLPSSFPISNLAKAERNKRLKRSSWRDFASSDPLISPLSTPRESFALCPPFPPWESPLFEVNPSLPIPSADSHNPIVRRDAALEYLKSLPAYDLSIWTDGSVPNSLGKGGSGVLALCSLCGIEVSLSFSAGSVCSSFTAEPHAIMHALEWTRQHQQPCIFSSLILHSDSRSVLTSLSSPPDFLLPSSNWQIWHSLSLLSENVSIRLQWIPGHSFLPGNEMADSLARAGALLQPSAIPCSLSPLSSSLYSTLFSEWRPDRNGLFDTQVPSVSTEELVFLVMYAASSHDSAATGTASYLTRISTE